MKSINSLVDAEFSRIDDVDEDLKEVKNLFSYQNL